jgi:hypothetical protein
MAKEHPFPRESPVGPITSERAQHWEHLLVLGIPRSFYSREQTTCSIAGLDVRLWQRGEPGVKLFVAIHLATGPPALALVPWVWGVVRCVEPQPDCDVQPGERLHVAPVSLTRRGGRDARWAHVSLGTGQRPGDDDGHRCKSRGVRSVGRERRRGHARKPSENEAVPSGKGDMIRNMAGLLGCTGDSATPQSHTFGVSQGTLQ